VGQTGTPPPVEDVRHRIERLEVEIGILRREAAAGRTHAGRLDELAAQLEGARASRQALEARWQDELAAVRAIQARQRELEALAAGPEGPGPDAEPRRAELARLQTALESRQGEEPMVPFCVDARVIAGVISGWTGIPVGRMLADELRGVLALKERLAERIVGQPQALDALCRRIRTYRASLDDPGKPTGVFLLVGPSGVGKTETAIALADLLYGGERSMVAINMSEYQEAYTVSGLKGSPQNAQRFDAARCPKAGRGTDSIIYAQRDRTDGQDGNVKTCSSQCSVPHVSRANPECAGGPFNRFRTSPCRSASATILNATSTSTRYFRTSAS
jgi:type VI secretion system protein VasG